jgi:Ca2+-transporting ATPase
VFNAVIALRQEAKAEESVAALARMMKTIARMRRGSDAGGRRRGADAGRCGDEAGNRAPADRRICVAAPLEIEEAALISESAPVAKGTGPVPGRRCRCG